jgi:hypothetical protein
MRERGLVVAERKIFISRELKGSSLLSKSSLAGYVQAQALSQLAFQPQVTVDR